MTCEDKAGVSLKPEGRIERRTNAAQYPMPKTETRVSAAAPGQDLPKGQVLKLKINIKSAKPTR